MRRVGRSDTPATGGGTWDGDIHIEVVRLVKELQKIRRFSAGPVLHYSAAVLHQSTPGYTQQPATPPHIPERHAL